MHESLKTALSVDEFARLNDIAKEAGTDVLILPGGGHERLEQFLTCDRCGRFVCYKHNPELKPMYKAESVNIPTPEHDGWSRPIAAVVIQRFTDELKVTMAVIRPSP